MHSIDKKELHTLRFVLGLLFSSSIGLLAYRRRSLSRSGILGAIVTGTTSFGYGGLAWGLSLIFFFVSSSFLSHFRAQDKASTAADKFSKGSQRDLAQVAANGGVASAMALGHGLSTQSATRAAFAAGYIGALATANADTWATELGVLSTQPPRLITTWQTTTVGTSGGITPMGTTAAASGALAQGLVFKLLYPATSAFTPLIALVSGLTGSMFDSLLGATVQAIYYCPTCDKETEQRIHNCGTSTQPLRGLAWMNNDMVNFLATLCGSLISISIHIPLQNKKVRPIK
jgi:uncharacterized protein (TIGR00297 family)